MGIYEELIERGLIAQYRNSSLYYYAHIQYMNGQYDLALKNFRELQTDKKFAKIAPSYIARIYYYLGKDDELLNMAPVLLKDKDIWGIVVLAAPSFRPSWADCGTSPAPR